MAYGELKNADNYVLGSGELYLGTIENVETANEETIAKALENVGAIESGASLSYTPTTKPIESGNRGVIAQILTKEEVKFKTGIITWCIENLSRLAPAKMVEDTEQGTKTLTLGRQGLIPVNYLRFVHKGNGYDLIINIFKASSEGGFEFTFDKENPLSVNYEFIALSKMNGSLVEIIEKTHKVPSGETTALLGFSLLGNATLGNI